MSGGVPDDDRAAVLEVVRAYFTEASPAVEELLGGRMLEWGRLRGRPAWMDRFEADRTLESRTSSTSARPRRRRIVRAGSRKLPFRLDVPFAVPETVVAQPPPQRLPIRRWTIKRWLVVCTAISVIVFVWFGWYGLVAPLLFGAVLYERARIYGKLPEPVYRMRYALDVLVVAFVFLLLWFTPAVRLAVPAVVAILTYMLARHVARRSAGFSVVTGMSIGIAWLGLLGIDTGPLSPCRLADGKPAAAADAFVRNVLSGTGRLAPADVEAGVATREALSGELRGDSARGCYRYVSTAVGRFAVMLSRSSATAAAGMSIAPSPPRVRA